MLLINGSEFESSYITKNAQLRYKFLPVLLEDYKNGNLWNQERHKYLPLFLQERIESFLKCVKIYCKKTKIIFPKPLLKMIIKTSVKLFSEEARLKK